MSLQDDIEHLLASWATAVTNRALDADPDLRARLDQLEGRSLELAATNPSFSCHLVILKGELVLKPGSAAAPNVVVHGSARDLLAWVFNQDVSGVRVEGDDTTLLETLATLRSYNPDLEESLRQVFGDQLAQRVVGGAEAGLRGLQSILEGLGNGLENEAGERFVQRKNLDDLTDRIGDLRLRVDRLAANIRAKENPP